MLQCDNVQTRRSTDRSYWRRQKLMLSATCQLLEQQPDCERLTENYFKIFNIAGGCESGNNNSCFTAPVIDGRSSMVVEKSRN